MYCIYRITNLANGKTYIGKHRYKKLNDSYMGSGKHLKRAQKKYGIKNFKKDILVFNISKLEQVNLLEETFIASEREKVGFENCYNITNGGDGGNGGSCKGRRWKLSAEARKNISEAKKGERNPMYGKPGTNKGKHWKLSEETKRKLSEAGKGRHHSEETRKKIAEAHKGERNPMYGRAPWNKGKKNVKTIKIYEKTT